MVILGIISDTHVMEDDDPKKFESLLNELKIVFKDVDEIIHAGDVCCEWFFSELNKITTTSGVKGNMDMDDLDLKNFIKLKFGKYEIGVIHEPPENLEEFFKEKALHILIHGHTHVPLIKGTPYNTLKICPGSTSFPIAPPQKRGFDKPIARPSVIKLKIDENDMLSTFLINLKL